MKGVKVINNTKGQKSSTLRRKLAKYPNKVPSVGVYGKCVYGSVKHMMSIQKCGTIAQTVFFSWIAMLC